MHAPTGSPGAGPAGPTDDIGSACTVQPCLLARASSRLGRPVPLVLAGGVCAVLVGGVVGEVLTIVLISGGLAGALLLLFLEVGLSEERELAREEERRRRRPCR